MTIERPGAAQGPFSSVWAHERGIGQSALAARQRQSPDITASERPGAAGHMIGIVSYPTTLSPVQRASERQRLWSGLAERAGVP